jgi:oxygen-independent coproporphyrinogen-3 oxidase
VFIGGGTPSLLPADLFGSFLERLRRRIGSPAEFSVEVNPESLSREFLQVLSAGAVNRISMGVQTYDGALLNWLGRPAGPEALFRADALLADFWKGRLSRDLLAALPGRDGRLLGDVRRALGDNPGHLSVYELTVEEGTPLSGNPSDLALLPEADERCGEWKSLLSELKKRGYRRYEVSNFARPGEEVLHNLRYWRMKPYLGIGPGAVSTLPAVQEPVQDPVNEAGVSAAVRIENAPDLERWLADPFAAALKTDLSAGELMLEHFMMALRTSEGLSRHSFRDIFQFDPVDAAPRAMDRWCNSGMLLVDEDFIAPTEGGMDFVDSMLSDIAAESDRPGIPRCALWPAP